MSTILPPDREVLQYTGREDTASLQLPVTKLSGSLEVVHITSDNQIVDTVIFNSFRDRMTIYPKLTYAESHENSGNGFMISLNPSDPVNIFGADPVHRGLLTIADACPLNRKSLNSLDTKYTLTRLSVGNEFIEAANCRGLVKFTINNEHTFGIVSWIGDGVQDRALPISLPEGILPDFMAIKAFDTNRPWCHWRSSKIQQMNTSPHSDTSCYSYSVDNTITVDQDGLHLDTDCCNLAGSVYYAYCFFGEDAAHLGISLF